MAATASVTALHPHDLSAALHAADEWERVLNTEIIEHETEIHLFRVAMATKESMLLAGVPGIAKSLTFDRGVAYTDGARYFKEQLHEMITPEQLLGPWSMQGLMKDQFRRVTRWQDDGGNWHESNWSQNCHVVLWDEAYKGSESITNVPLMMMNERQLNDNGIIIPVPLWCFLVTANEERRSDSQLAFDDRLLLRCIVDRVRDRAARRRLLELGDPDPHPTPVITVAQWETIQAAVRSMPVADETKEMILDIEDALLAAGVNISPRRLRKCVKFVQAEALFSGADRAETEHVAILEHCAWLDQKDQPKAQQIVLSQAAPMRKKALELLADVEKVGAAVSDLLDNAGADGPDVSEAARLQADLTGLNRKIDRLRPQAEGSRHARDVITRCVDRKNDIAMRLLVEGMRMSPANVQAMLTNAPRV